MKAVFLGTTFPQKDMYLNWFDVVKHWRLKSLFGTLSAPAGTNTTLQG